MIVTLQELNWAFESLPKIYTYPPSFPPNRYRVPLPRLRHAIDPREVDSSASITETPTLEFELVATPDNNIKTWKLATKVSIIHKHRPFDERL